MAYTSSRSMTLMATSLPLSRSSLLIVATLTPSMWPLHRCGSHCKEARGCTPFVNVSKGASADALKALISIYIYGEAFGDLWDLGVSRNRCHAVPLQVEHCSRADHMQDHPGGYMHFICCLILHTTTVSHPKTLERP